MTPDTPALQALRAAGLDHEVLSHGPVRSLAEAAEARGVEPADVVKTLVVRRGEDDHLLVLVPGLRTISWPRLRALLGVSRLSMPDAAAAKAATGYERGTITPFGTTRAWPVVADERVRGRRITLGAGEHGLAVALDADAALVALSATVADISDPEGETERVTGRPQVTWQGSLFDEQDGGAPERRLSFDALRRDPLDARSWLDVAPGWVPDHAALFERLLEIAPWQQRTRTMWDTEVLEPRLVANWPTGAELPPEVLELTAPLGERYGVELDSCLVNLYRDGSDAVAWHADTVRKTMRNPLVATVSLGARRSFLLRPAGGGPVQRRYAPGEGDLIVMGGACQHEWHHTVPREKSASGARMSITLRHSRPARGGGAC